jgi:uncharacterized protein
MRLDSNQIIEKTEKYVQDFFQEEATGHDWWHTHRVKKLALKIAKEERADLFIVEMAALLHDIGDYKFFGGDEKKALEVVDKYLNSLSLESFFIKKILDIINNISFMKTLSQENNSDIEKKSPEFKSVSDADKLDAMGAIGIARVFTYGGYYHRPIYDPAIPPNPDISREEYKTTENPSLNHFYEKLLKLKDMMYTGYGKKLAIERHQFMVEYLMRFYQEWRGEK